MIEKDIKAIDFLTHVLGNFRPVTQEAAEYRNFLLGELIKAKNLHFLAQKEVYNG